MRIAYVCADPGVPVFGRKGSSIHVQEVLHALRPYVSRIDLFAASLGGDQTPEDGEITVYQLPNPASGERATREQAAIAANDVLRKALERAGPFDLVYERYSLWSFAAMEYARDRGAPGLLEVNAPLIEEQQRYRGLVHHASAERVAERVFGATAALLAVSREVAAYLRRYPGARGRVHVVPNAVNPDRFPPNLAPSCPGPPGIFTVGFLGTLKPWHGLPWLVEAFATLHARAPEARLLIVGDGPERADLEANLRRRGLLAAARFTGAVDHADVPGMLASMDVAVAPYPPQGEFYFSPLKVYEYMAAGLPVIASRIGQLAEVMQHGVNGLLCPPDDPPALAAALEQLLLEPGLRARLGRAARETVLRNHTWDQVARRILSLAAAVRGEAGRVGAASPSQPNPATSSPVEMGS